MLHEVVEVGEPVMLPVMLGDNAHKVNKDEKRGDVPDVLVEDAQDIVMEVAQLNERCGCTGCCSG